MSGCPAVALHPRRCGWMLALLWLAAGAWAQLAEAQPADPEGLRVLDRFDDLGAWKAAASDGATAALSAAQGVAGPALRLDFDLRGTAGYAAAARALRLDLPPNYEISFSLRADAAENDFQVKLVDASGDNVWWFHRRNFAFPHQWQRIRIRKRQIEFAWGPTTERELHHAERLEFVVAAGRGGAGSIYLSDLTIRELPAEPASWPAPVVRASSHLPAADPAPALDGDVATAWRSDPSTGAAQTLTIDFGRPREFGGLIVRWQGGAFATRYDVQFSDDGEGWRTVRSVSEGRGGPDGLALADARTRFVRLDIHDGPLHSYAIAEVEVLAAAPADSQNALFQALARDSPRGWYPRGFSGEQPYWTIVGVDGGADSGLLSEDGTLEVASGGFSIEPFVVAGSRLTTWADLAPKQSLADGYLPLPSVTWPHSDWQLRVSAFASGTRQSSELIARYELRNLSASPISLRLVLGIRPFQVNSPMQFLNIEGGASRVRDVDWDGRALTVNHARHVLPLRAPDRVGIAAFDSGPVPQWLTGNDWPGRHNVHDPAGYASAALGFDIVLAPGKATTIGLVVPLSGTPAAPPLAERSSRAWMAHEEQNAIGGWRARLNRVTFELPRAAQPLIDTLRTALAHILISRDGPILRPGTRSYSRSWIRDGAMMSESLLRLGHVQAAADYLRWFAPYQFADGKIPCCVDARGADPVAENDSDGEFLFLADEVERYRPDPALATSLWPHILAAVRHLDALREAGRKVDDVATEHGAFYGLLPASISHEGYAAKPMHSYWDDFWAVKGYAAAIDLAHRQGAPATEARWQAASDEFDRDLAVSLREATAVRGISFLPGAAELGDFDPASTAIGLAPGAAALDPSSPLVQATFERYWQEFVARRDGEKAWNEYTPYELRIVGAFLRLGWRERAHELLSFFLAGRRPQAWNQWAEVVGRDARQPRFIGDMPHAWVASDFIGAVLDLFAYEREADRTLLLARGIPPAWLDGPGIAVHDLRTPYGLLSYRLRRDHARTILRIDRDSGLPPGGFVFVWSGATRTPAASINGKPVPLRSGELRINELPATVVIDAAFTDTVEGRPIAAPTNEQR
jgi:hypothetical protein